MPDTERNSASQEEAPKQATQGFSCWDRATCVQIAGQRCIVFDTTVRGVDATFGAVVKPLQWFKIPFICMIEAPQSLLSYLGLVTFGCAQVLAPGMEKTRTGEAEERVKCLNGRAHI
jgi:hypothetical protein